MPQRLYIVDESYTAQNTLEDAILTELKNYPKEHDPRTLIVAIAGKAGISDPPTVDDYERMQETLRDLKTAPPESSTPQVVRFDFISRKDFVQHCKDSNTRPTLGDAQKGSKLCYDSISKRQRGRRIPEEMNRSIVKIRDEIEKEIPTFPYTLGLRRDPPDSRDYEASRMLTVKDEELPKSISYREQMTAVRDQQNLGSCTAFAVTALREWQEQLKPQRMPIEVLSPLFLYQKTKEIDNWPDEQATSLRFALKALRRWGCAMEKYYPYRDDWPIRTQPPWHTYGRARWEKIGSYHRLRTKQEMRRWLVEHGPFVLGVPVGREIFDPKPPDYEVPPPSNVVGGHAICIVGYDEQGRFIFKNSWSSSWGSDGYAKLSADYLDKIDWFDGWGFLAEK